MARGDRVRGAPLSCHILRAFEPLSWDLGPKTRNRGKIKWLNNLKVKMRAEGEFILLATQQISKAGGGGVAEIVSIFENLN